MMTPEPINLRVGRIASLIEAAHVVYVGSGLVNADQRATVSFDLIDLAARLAAELASDTEEARYGVTAG